MIDDFLIIGAIAAGLIVAFFLAYMVRESRRGRH